MKKLLVVAALFSLAVPSTLFAHGGGLDASGCHHDRKRGDYHCHRGPSQADAQKAPKTPSAKLKKEIKSSTEASVSKDIVGVASVIDGDTINIHGQRIRLHGIDAPESAQLCRSTEGKEYRCGQHAALALSDKIGKKTVTCRQKDVDRYQRIVATCSIKDIDLNGWMVSQGHALAYQQYSKDYVELENQAKVGKVGIWQGEFDAPWDWRKAKKK